MAPFFEHDFEIVKFPDEVDGKEMINGRWLNTLLTSVIFLKKTTAAEYNIEWN